MVIGLRSKNSHRIACEYSADMMLRIFARVPLAGFKVPSQDSTATVLMSESGDIPHFGVIHWDMRPRGRRRDFRPSDHPPTTSYGHFPERRSSFLLQSGGVTRVLSTS